MRLLINKQIDPDTGNVQILSTQQLDETENITYEIIDVPMMMEEKDGHTKKYVWNNETNQLDVEYIKNPVSTEERIAAMQEAIDLLLMGGI